MRHPDHRQGQLDEDPYAAPYYHPGNDAEEIQYMLEKREVTGRVPAQPEAREQQEDPARGSDKAFSQTKKGSGHQEVATTMAFVRLLKDLMREKGIGNRMVPDHP